MAAALTHIALHVSDVRACTEFYRSFCGMQVVHERADSSAKGEQVVWLAEPSRADEFIIVLVPGGAGHDVPATDFSHLGFALPSREEVDAIAERARRAGCLIWEPKEEPYPVGYYCGVQDPDGNQVEFSYGQPLGPGAEV